MFTQAWDSQFEEMLQRGVPLEEYMEQCEKGYLNCAFEKYQNSYKVADALGTSQSLIMRRKEIRPVRAVDRKQSDNSRKVGIDLKNQVDFDFKSFLTYPLRQA